MYHETRLKIGCYNEGLLKVKKRCWCLQSYLNLKGAVVELTLLRVVKCKLIADS